MLPIIQVQHLMKKFRNIAAVNDVSFEVQEREIFSFLGPNGAGKTTIINTLCTLLKPTSGRATRISLVCLYQREEFSACCRPATKITSVG
jgi:ABC-type multidrug transport system ATPase subunit